MDICHENGREAMMFLGDHWIGTEPFGEYFKEVGIRRGGRLRREWNHPFASSPDIRG